MKKIAFVSWDMTVLGGVNQVTITLANELSSYYDVSIISLVKGSGGVKPSLDSKIQNIYYVMEKECRGREVLFKGRTKLKQFVKKNEIDVLFLMGFQVALPTIIMCGKKSCKYIFCDHEALRSRSNERKITFVRYLAAVLSNKVITLTEKNAMDYHEFFHLAQRKIDYIYNSISEKILINSSPKYDETSRIILSVGRFSPEKGYDILINVAETVLKNNPSWKWIVYGNGETYSEIQQEIKKRRLENNLILQGEVNDVSRIYGQAAMFVLTSRREGLPLVLLEAKANHLPCISFDVVSGPNEIIRDQIDGILVKPFDQKKMVDTIEKLITNEELRTKMAREASGNLDKFSSTKIIEKWKKIIETI